ncbi:MAG: PASTA domain-containing protein [Eggerthella lenta]
MVVEQSIAAGTKVDRGSTVTVKLDSSHRFGRGQAA